MVPSTEQGFLDRCFKRQFCSKYINVNNLLEIQDRNIFKKVSNTVNYPLLPSLPRIKSTHYNLRRNSSEKPKINTVRSLNIYVNRLVFLVFKYNLALEQGIFLHLSYFVCFRFLTCNIANVF